MRLDSSLCSALVACWRSWLPALPGVQEGGSVPLTDPQKGSKERLQTSTTVVLCLSRFGSLGESTCVNGPWAACDVPLLKEAPNCFKDFQRREVGRYIGSKVCFFCLMIRYFVSYLCHICDTFYLKAVRAQQELDMLRQARISSAYVCLWVRRHVTHS
eukprot:g25593.t1